MVYLVKERERERYRYRKQLARFRANSLERVKQMKVACHDTNLQPLWAEESLIKGPRIL